ncbi:MAG: glycosyltransferase WbuB, partial [bacterium]
MHILIIVDCYIPSTKSSAKLVNDLAGEFCCLGHEVTVLAADNELVSDSKISYENGVKILRIKTGKRDGVSKVVRGFNEMMFSP